MPLATWLATWAEIGMFPDFSMISIFVDNLVVVGLKVHMRIFYPFSNTPGHIFGLFTYRQATIILSIIFGVGLLFLLFKIGYALACIWFGYIVHGVVLVEEEVWNLWKAECGHPVQQVWDVHM